LDSITIFSDDPSGIENLININGITVTRAPGLSGKGVAVIKKIRNTFGGNITVRELMAIFNDYPQLVTELNEIGKFEVIHA
jgi:hypothetical protein